MTDTEFDVMDELYFVQSFEGLQQVLSIAEPVLKEVLAALVKNGWVKCLLSPDEEVPEDKFDFKNNYKQYYYLATKAGLFAHNSI